jgi:hypothetical protein
MGFIGTTVQSARPPERCHGPERLAYNSDPWRHGCDVALVFAPIEAQKVSRLVTGTALTFE